MEGVQDAEYEMMASVTEKRHQQELYKRTDTTQTIYATVGEVNPTQPTASTTPPSPKESITSPTKPTGKVKFVVAVIITVALITVAILALVVVMTVTIVDQDGYRELRRSVLRIIQDNETFNKTIVSLTGSVSSIWNILNTNQSPQCTVNDTLQCTINNNSSGDTYWKTCHTPRVNLLQQNGLYPVDVRCDYQSLMENRTISAGSARLVRVDRTTVVCICDVFQFRAINSDVFDDRLNPLPPTLNISCILTTVWCADHGR